MTLDEILGEGTNYSNSPIGPEIKLPVYTKDKFDYGDASNKLTASDVVVKASDTGNIYGRRRTVQRTLKKAKRSKKIK